MDPQIEKYYQCDEGTGHVDVTAELEMSLSVRQRLSLVSVLMDEFSFSPRGTVQQH